MVPISEGVITSNTPLEKIDPQDVGGKGWNLFRLVHYGFPVPPWVVVSSRVFDKALAGKRTRLNEILSTINFSDRKDLDQAVSLINELVFHSQFPKAFLERLCSRIEGIFGPEALLSVRSSVVGEDSSQNSFAGQMDSFLNVRLSDIVPAIKRIWASAFSSRALLYRHRKQLPPMGVSTAVIIQKMVQSAASGVLFTRDPETRRKQCIISAAFGLGEGVVSNRVEADTYWIDWKGEGIRKDISFKSRRVVLNEKDQGGNQMEPVPPSMSGQQVIVDSVIRQLRDVGIRVEASFGSPQDVEWAHNTKGRLFVLQTRPIVFRDDERSPSASRIWDNSNIVESYPGLTLPLTFSFILKGYERSFRRVARGFLMFGNEIEKDLHIFRNLVGLLDGRVYYNLLNWYQMLSYLPGFQRYRESWDEMIGIKEKVQFQENRLSSLNRYMVRAIAIWRLLTVERNARKFLVYFDAAYQRFQEFEISLASEEKLIHLFQSLERAFADKWHPTLYNDFCAIKYFDILKQLCQRWGLEQYPNLHNDLLCGEYGVESVAPIRSLVRLAESFHADPTCRALLAEKENHLIWQEIQKEPRYAELKSSLQAHLESFGDRGLEELKLERPGFREDPASLITWIRDYSQRGLSIETLDRRQQAIRRNAESIVARSVRNPARRLLFWFVLKNARRAIAHRENMRFARTRLYGMVRRLFRRMADLFVTRGLVESPSDLFYLTVEEILGFVQGTAVTQNLKAIVEIRKSEYEEFSQRVLKERLQTYGIPYLNSLSENGCQKGTAKTLQGIGCSSGIAEGGAAIVFNPNSSMGVGDSILITRSTDPGWVFLMVSSKGLVVEKGSVLSHTAIIGREFGIPTIVGAKDATRLIPPGAQVTMNGSTGEIRWQ